MADDAIARARAFFAHLPTISAAHVPDDVRALFYPNEVIHSIARVWMTCAVRTQSVDPLWDGDRGVGLAFNGFAATNLRLIAYSTQRRGLFSRPPAPQSAPLPDIERESVFTHAESEVIKDAYIGIQLTNNQVLFVHMVPSEAAHVTWFSDYIAAWRVLHEGGYV